MQFWIVYFVQSKKWRWTIHDFIATVIKVIRKYLFSVLLQCRFQIYYWFCKIKKALLQDVSIFFISFTAAAAAKKEEDLPYDEKPIEENLNRMVIEGDEARTIDEAISVLR